LLGHPGRAAGHRRLTAADCLAGPSGPSSNKPTSSANPVPGTGVPARRPARQHAAAHRNQRLPGRRTRPAAL